MRVLVTGGTGYIGAHVVRLLKNRGDHVIVADDVITGIRSRIGDVPLIELDLAADHAVETLARAMSEHSIDSVIHLAALKQVGESVEKAALYYRQNVGGTANLLLAMQQAGITSLVFSSSAAVYGSADGAVDESSPTPPINPYGETKLIGEWLIAAATKSFELRAISLRYFNVAGAGWPELGDRAALNLVPMVFERMDAGEPPRIFGDDYATPDGTCVRDFVHVLDVAEAHLATLDRLHGGQRGHRVYNIGTGSGTSVREVVDAILEVSGLGLTAEVLPRRAGDAATVVAVTHRITEEIGWVSTRGIRDIVKSAWESHEHFAR